MEQTQLVRHLRRPPEEYIPDDRERRIPASHEIGEEGPETGTDPEVCISGAHIFIINRKGCART